MGGPPADGSGAEARTRFGPYELMWEIGAGGMAVVHAANLPGPGGFEKLVCIKRIRPEMTESDGWIESFVTEAKLAAHIHHPNVVQVQDLGCVDDTYYIAMEYVGGIDLLTILKKAGEKEILLPVSAATYIAREVCLGLDAAHRQCDLSGRPLGIVHRDVSPQNVLVSYEGQVKITDFGVAKSKIKLLTTMPGTIKGKANYMSPEQARGQPLDARSDIFAVGILLHELLSGEPFYPVSDMARLITLARKKPKVEPLSTYRDDVLPELEETVRMALAFDPVDRFGSADDMAMWLSDVLAQTDPTYGQNDLAQLLDWLFDYSEAPEEPEPAQPLEAAPTRVASAEEIRQRRMRRAAGLHVRPAPPGVKPANTTRPGFGRRMADFARRLFADTDAEG